MKKLLILSILFIMVSTVAFTQGNQAANEKLKQEIITLETAGWQAWQNNDVAWVTKNTSNDFIMVFGDGVRNKNAVLTATANECKVKSFALSDFKFVMLNENAVLMTYTALQNAICGGKKSAPKVQASVNYVKREGKWLEAFYTETPVTQ